MSKDHMETEIIDKLFLELSQISKAKTKRELLLEDALLKFIRAGNGQGTHFVNQKAALDNAKELLAI